MNLFALLLLSSFSGSYSGSGRAVFGNGKVYECSEVFLRMNQTIDTFKLSDGGYICGVLQASFDPFRFMIKNGNLINAGQVFGTISEKVLEYKMYDPEDDSTYHLKLIRTSSENIFYHEEWFDGKKLALTVKGDLKAL